MPPPKKTAKKVAEPAPDQKAIGEHDVVLDFSLKLRTKDGDPVDVEGSIPFNNALVPVFIADTQQSVQQMVETIVRDRFLLQARHFFNQKREASIPKMETTPLLEQKDNKSPSTRAQATSQADDAFGFEEDESKDSKES